MSLASGQLTLSKDEKSIGTVLVDIGAGATTIAVFENGAIAATSTLPIGGEYITNDISIGLAYSNGECRENQAEIWLCVWLKLQLPSKDLKLPRIGSNVDKEFTQVELANIIEPRVQEIFQLIRAEVYRLGYGDAARWICFDWWNRVNAGYAGILLKLNLRLLYALQFPIILAYVILLIRAE